MINSKWFKWAMFFVYNVAGWAWQTLHDSLLNLLMYKEHSLLVSNSNSDLQLFVKTIFNY